MYHLTRGSQLCLLNLVARIEPFTYDAEAHHRDAARMQSAENNKKGEIRHKATCPAYRIPWVCNALFDLSGDVVQHDDSRHPWTLGSGKLFYGWKTAGGEIEDFS